MPNTRKHYVARVTVTRVTKTLATTRVYSQDTRQNEDVVSEADRDTREIAGLTFSAATPDELSTKIAAHIALITDGEADAGA